MIKRIEIRNFESHEHTVIDGLSPGLNLIWGESNTGKTSIIRALRLVAYNQFDPRSVRVGQTDCEVTVTTDRGSVKVVRGKENHWEVTRNGEDTVCYDRIGKATILPEVTEVLGMGLVKLADIELAPNIMDQLEGHFLLAELDGNHASGSVRAQVVDEISGLTGVETLIRSVSKDNLAWTKAIHRSEQQVQELEGDLHDEDELERERDSLSRAQECCENHGRGVSEGDEASAMFTRGGRFDDSLDGLRARLRHLPETSGIEPKMPVVARQVEDMDAAVRMSSACASVDGSLRGVNKWLAALPDTEPVKARLPALDGAIDQERCGRRIERECGQIDLASSSLDMSLATLPSENAASTAIRPAVGSAPVLANAVRLQGALEQLRALLSRTAEQVSGLPDAVAARNCEEAAASARARADELRTAHSRCLAVRDGHRRHRALVDAMPVVEDAEARRIAAQGLIGRLAEAERISASGRALQGHADAKLHEMRRLRGVASHCKKQLRTVYEEIGGVCPLTGLPLAPQCKEALIQEIEQ